MDVLTKLGKCIGNVMYQGSSKPFFATYLMRNISHLIFWLLLSIPQTLSKPSNQPVLDKQEVAQLDEHTIDSLLNPQLQNALRAIIQEKPAKMVKKKATRLLLAAMDEFEPHILPLVKFLIAYFEKKPMYLTKIKSCAKHST